MQIFRSPLCSTQQLQNSALLRTVPLSQWTVSEKLFLHRRKKQVLVMQWVITVTSLQSADPGKLRAQMNQWLHLCLLQWTGIKDLLNCTESWIAAYSQHVLRTSEVPSSGRKDFYLLHLLLLISISSPNKTWRDLVCWFPGKPNHFQDHSVRISLWIYRTWSLGHLGPKFYICLLFGVFSCGCVFMFDCSPLIILIFESTSPCGQ